MRPSLISKLSTSFQNVANLQAETASKAKPKKKTRLPPLSIRVSEAERARLKRDAGNKPLSTYAKERIFRAPPSRAGKIDDPAALARVLSALGQTELFRNLGTLVQSIEDGDVVLTPQQQEQIGIACAAVLLMRNDLVRALGLKPE